MHLAEIGHFIKVRSGKLFDVVSEKHFGYPIDCYGLAESYLRGSVRLHGNVPTFVGFFTVEGKSN